MLNVQQVRLRFAFAKLLVSASSLFKNTDSKTYGASTASIFKSVGCSDIDCVWPFAGKMCEILLKINEDFLFTSGKNGFIIYM